MGHTVYKLEIETSNFEICTLYYQYDDYGTCTYALLAKNNRCNIIFNGNSRVKSRLCCDRSTRLVSLLLGFGGGVLFCTTFLHLLPEVKEGLEHLTAEGKLPELSFSLAEALTCAG